MYFHAQYRQRPVAAQTQTAAPGPKLNPAGRDNYAYMETPGRAHPMGATPGPPLNPAGCWGAGAEMV